LTKLAGCRDLSTGTPDKLLADARQELLRGLRGANCARIDALIDAGSATADALHLKGLCEARLGSWSAAASWFRRALEASPDQAGWLRDLGSVMGAQGDWAGAADAFSQAIAHAPQDHAAMAGYGRAMLEQNRPSDAIPYLTRAARLRTSASVLVSLGRALAAESRLEEAADALNRAIVLEPHRVDAHRVLGRVASVRADLELAERCWENVLRLAPGDGEADQQLIRVRWKLGELLFALNAIEAKVLDGSASESMHAFWLYIQMYDWQTGAERRRLCEGFGRRVTPDVVRRFRPDRWPLRASAKLRIGYLTGEFISGPPFYFLSSLMANHHLEEFDVFLYHTRDQFDDGTRWYSRFANWRDCRGLEDDVIRKLIAADKIQILVDLSAFFPDNRLRIFAGRAAPVQVTYPNCPTTTGVAEIDYIFTDRWTCKRGWESQYTERAAYLPSGYLVYSPPADSPELTPLPASRHGVVTFGVFQRRAKMRPEFWDAVASILLACEQSHLLVQNYDAALDDPESRIYQSLMAELISRGVSHPRISLRGARPHRETLQTMAEVDIALDTFPYQGQTTSCECLWQGVPVVALSGDTHVSRVGTALLLRAGLRCLVASTRASYIRKAVNLAADLTSLAQLRAGMRDRLARSSVLDGALLARNVERMYRRMWRAWCRGEFLGSDQPLDRRSQKGESGQRCT
jgi:protein O-GlcNAc transferase